jgi:large subunit ribosomal protein L29
MNAKELRELSPVEIQGKVNGLEEERFNLRFQHKMGQLTNPQRIREVRRGIARAKTVLNQMKTQKPAKAS